MANDGITFRRATVEDLPALKSLWTAGGRQASALEKRLTEFQVAIRQDGNLVGSVGLRLSGKQGLVHDETYANPSQGEILRSSLWERLQKVAHNHGLLRVWLLETEPFWSVSAQFRPATPEMKLKLPKEFGLATEPWQVLPLREESETLVSMENEMEVFQKAQRAETEALMQRAKVYRVIAFVIATLFLMGTLVFVSMTVRNDLVPNPSLKMAPPPGTNSVPP